MASGADTGDIEAASGGLSPSTCRAITEQLRLLMLGVEERKRQAERNQQARAERKLVEEGPRLAREARAPGPGERFAEPAEAEALSVAMADWRADEIVLIELGRHDLCEQHFPPEAFALVEAVQSKRPIKPAALHHVLAVLSRLHRATAPLRARHFPRAIEHTTASPQRLWAQGYSADEEVEDDDD